LNLISQRSGWIRTGRLIHPSSSCDKVAELVVVVVVVFVVVVVVVVEVG
jgi:hypothetical protein